MQLGGGCIRSGRSLELDRVELDLVDLVRSGFGAFEDEDVCRGSIDDQLLPNRCESLDADGLPAIFDRHPLGCQRIVDGLELGPTGNALRRGSLSSGVIPLLIPGEGNVREERGRDDKEQI